MLNKKEIRDKKKYVITRLRNNSEDIESDNLKYTLAELLLLELSSDELKNLKFYNIAGVLTHGSFVSRNMKEFSLISNDINNYVSATFDDSYISFLLDLTYNLNKIETDYDDERLESIDVKDEDCIQLSKSFFKDLGDQELYDKSSKVLYDSSHFGFTDTVLDQNRGAYGWTFYDTVFNKPYCVCKRINNYMEYQAFNHEVVHATDFYFMPKTFDKINFGFQEIPTYTLDYLFLDYLDSIGMDSDKVNTLREKKQAHSKLVANQVLFGIKRMLSLNYKIYNIDEANMSQIRSVLNNDIIYDILELESIVVAEGLYRQIKSDKEEGLNNLKKFMKNSVPKGKIPDFSFIGLDNNTLLSISEDMGNTSRIIK